CPASISQADAGGIHWTEIKLETMPCCGRHGKQDDGSPAMRRRGRPASWARHMASSASHMRSRFVWV
ncbi:MAG: hypothetical protein ACREII_08580, partial [Nitrospiraceae bacterium]